MRTAVTRVHSVSRQSRAMTPPLPLSRRSGLDIVDFSLLFVLLFRPLADLSHGLAILEIGRSDSIAREVFNPAGILSVLVVLLVGVVFTRDASLTRRLPLPALAYLALTVWAAFAISWAEQRLIAIAHFSRLCSILAVILLVIRSCRHQRAPRIIWTIIAISSMIPATVGLYQAYSGTGNLEATIGVNRSFGTFVHPNPFAHYLVLASLATFGLILIVNG